MEIFKKKKLFCFLFLFFTFIPFISVKALTGNDGVEYPDLPEDAYTSNYAILKKLTDEKIYLYTWDTENIYIASTEVSSRNGLQLYFSGVFGDWDGDSNYPFNQKIYVLENGVWSLSSSYKVGSRDYMYHAMPLFSTTNIYNDGYGTQTYPSGYYYLSGTFAEEEVIYYANTVLQPFEELIPTSLYKGLVFTFNTSNVTSDDILSFNYNFYASDENYNIIDSTFEIPYFGYNGKDIYSDGSYTLNYQTNQLDAIPKNNYINDNFLQSFKYFESEYKLFINFEMLEDNYLYAYLDSPLNYTVEYIEREENLYYFDEVDITGKYGVVFIPNDVNNDYVTVMKFSDKSKYSVQLRDSYSETNENYNILKYYQIGFCDNLDVTGLVPVNCIDSYFLSLNNYFREKKQFVYVKNENNYDPSVKSVITYDTRYYTAYIQEYSNSNIEISNPNTGETDIFGPMTDFDNIYYEISNDNILELMHTFLEDLQQTSDTFNYMWNNFYSIMPDILKAFLQVITHLLCIWVFMKIVGYD